MYELYHHGIIGQKWGIRRFQNADGTLTPAGKRHYDKLDQKWTKKNYNKIYSETFKRSKAEMDNYVKNEMNYKYSENFRNNNFNKTMINDYNRKLAEVMNRNVGDLESPSGKIIQFVAKRGEAGVHMALATRGYDMSTVRNGIWDNGRVAYRKNVINKQ